MASLFNYDIEKLKGIGKVRGELLRKLGVNSVGDLLYFFPRAYEDWSDVTEICDVTDGLVCCVKATVCSNVEVVKKSGKIRFMSKLSVCDNSGVMRMIFFNNKYIDRMLIPDRTYYFYGKVSRDFSGVSMANPTFKPEKTSSEMNPVYKLTAGLNNNFVIKAVKNALEMLPEKVNDALPENIREKFGLMDLKSALNNIHFPKDNVTLEKARERLVVEELVVLNLGLRNLKNHNRGSNKNVIFSDFSLEFQKLLPYNLTEAQQKAINDCIIDMKAPEKTMNRLIQGDVGSGKTVVAGSVCYTAIKNGKQAAFMAPTELLAEQHYKYFSKLFENCGINVALLSGSMKEREKTAVREKLSCGEIDFVIGTHALITEKTTFNNLGLVVTDEQHRFGVNQRSKLLDKGNNPHLLVMSATPIPRTLGLIIYGDLDISIINQLPPNRQEIDTLLIDTSKRDRALGFIKKEIQRGRQAYIVCPLVEEGEMDLASTEEYGAELMLNYFAEIPVGIVHGKMKSAEKEQIMRDFVDNKIKILVATTVIEVGIDVPNSTIIMIENAERFGLSQLHQLRGRVGRGSEKSYCILVSDSLYGPSFERLKIMCTMKDGFKIADADFRMRGPGDFFGSRQHGLPELKIAGFSDTEKLQLSQEIADYILSHSHNLFDDEYRVLKRAVTTLFTDKCNNTLN